ncbi:MAG: hybrid sensor histidine kinase/response regulator, partial [Gammaproteobacteria bacterium HGW-Gammaproteobacteria-14]
RRQQAQQQPQEMVRIDAGVLESLVNLAGETSINRGRVEQGVTEFTFHVQEMGNTIERLYEQLRRLDSETEAQIMSNYQQGLESGQYGEDFDPLEMDQYSELHQITKQLSESASDLLDLKGTLLDRTRDTETLLLQQSRINTELQERLMRTRMVPFTRLVPRLRRIVRQVSGEIAKKVEFDVINPDGELDRTLMERIVAPLEHMLRNGVDHGIENPAERRAAGKDETGRISLELTREGGEVVMTLSDDGKGIDTDAVRRKAIERGLIEENTRLTDQEIQQFIFNAGFSTAAKVTQISGRGVGMDVVSSEIKQMGGSVSIDSKKGQGTRFTIRLPFTLAMNRALMVRVGEDNYAIPLNQIEGIVRISPYELENYFSEDSPPFVYARQSYELDYLGNFVHGQTLPSHLMNQQTPLPVLLIRSTEHQVAILVDGLVGSREVVVKSVGPQLATVAGISGATILGDGSVVIILDVHSLIRAAHVQRQHGLLERRSRAEQGLEPALPLAAEKPVEVAKLPLVMVTDDSVTVRKVTTRLLERNGYEVMTAKDGVDAVAKLEERKPDLMLLDIEMPRMDGFEVASHVRHDSRMKDIPIIMITSRTGEKHRERAFEIGVDRYMGKPFQEGELLATIQELLARKSETAGI